MTAEYSPCESCKLRIMADEGCCTQDVGLGVKPARINGHIVEVCKMLARDSDTGKLMCGDYNNRPEECRAFLCDRAVNAGDSNDIGSNVWDL